MSMTTDLTIDQALRQGRKSTDFATRKAAYDIVQEQLAKDVTVVPLLFDLYGNVHTKKVSGLSRPRAERARPHQPRRPLPGQELTQSPANGPARVRCGPRPQPRRWRPPGRRARTPRPRPGS